MKNKLLKILVFSLLTIGIVNAQAQVRYDLVINNGRVMDPETMYDAIANVGVTNGKIAIITQEKIEGKEVIDAEGQDSKVLKDVKPGQPIRYPVETKGRSQPVNVSKWINENTIFLQPIEDLDMSGLDDFDN